VTLPGAFTTTAIALGVLVTLVLGIAPAFALNWAGAGGFASEVVSAGREGHLHGVIGREGGLHGQLNQGATRSMCQPSSVRT
jgi:hypothetical protein